MNAYRNLLKKLVDVAGIEPATPCLQSSYLTSCKTFVFRHLKEDLGLSSLHRMRPGVPGCSHLIVGSLQKSLQSSANEKGAMA